MPLVHVVLRTPSTYELDLVLTNHYQSLECLKACPIQDSTPNAAKALFKCRKLRVLKLEAMDSMDVRYLIAQPWASQATLEDLQLPVGVRRQCRNKTMLKYASVEKEKLHLENPELEEWQQAEHLFMKRLGECTRLKYFSMRCATPWHPTLKEVDEGLSWQLSNGLMHLSSLACLERLDFDRTPFLLGMAELQFMQKHWPRLSVLRCVGIDSEEVRQWLQASWPTLYVYVVRLYNPQNPGFQHFETPPKGWWT
ncbi:hypothetical protein BGW41_006763 [Actinomortierella wolfii]|nr:hypothetical protein BGW41_006763 [Actinomortierella wolfii]